MATIPTGNPSYLTPEEKELRRITDQLMVALQCGPRGEASLRGFLEGAGLRGNALVASLLLTCSDQSGKVYAGDPKGFSRLDPDAVGRAIAIYLKYQQDYCSMAVASQGLGHDSIGGH